MSKENELGTLIVVVLKARNLNDKHSFYKQDVFAEISLNGVAKRTHIDVKGGQHPVWDAELRFPVMKIATEKHRRLEVACFAKESRSDDVLGKGAIDITETLKTGEFDDWVNLETNGVVRGDLYLEMTYYANAPAPVTALALPNHTSLHRRPSKLSPSDRLYRPPQPPVPSSAAASGPLHHSKPHHTQGRNPGFPDGNHLLPPSPSSSRSSSASSRKSSDAPLPPLPEDGIAQAPLPATLIPGGGGVRLKPQHDQTPHVPSILRPGNTKASPVSVLHRNTEYAVPGSHTYTENAPPSSSHHATVGHSPDSNPAPTAPPYTPLVSTPSHSWPTDRPSSIPLSFPVPSVTPVQENNGYNALNHLSEQQPSGYQGPNDDLPDPYLQVRYQTPLPLPPTDPASWPRGRQPLPVQSSPDPARFEALRLAEEEAARRKRRHDEDRELALQLDRAPRQSNQDVAHIEALRLEEETARRKEQEDKDLELALQLDRELNLGEEPTEQHTSVARTSAGMPGAW